MNAGAALDRALHIHVIYRDRGRVVHDEVLCRRCYEDLVRGGAFLNADNRRGRQTDVQPWHGEPRCVLCEATS